MDKLLFIVHLIGFVAGAFLLWWYVFRFVPMYLRVVDCHYQTQECNK